MKIHVEAIRAAGGRGELARRFGRKPSAVKDWERQSRGIPARYWHEIVKLAADKLPGLTIEALAQAKTAASKHTEAAE